MTGIDLVFSWLVRSALIGLVILLIGSGAVLLLRQPVRRLRMIELVLWACLLAPFLGMVPGYPQLLFFAPRTVAAKPLEPPFRPAMRPTIAAPENLPLPDRATPPMPGYNAPEAPLHAQDNRPWIVAAYLAGVALAIGWWLVGLVGLLRVLRTAKPAPPRCHELLVEISAGRGNRVRLLTSRRLKQPFASAWGRATIVLPEDLCGDERALRWCLAHEWAHVAGHDFRAWLLAGLARAMFFYQPLLWWLRRQLRLCQDFLADAQAAGQASQAEDYAEFLTALAAKGKWRPAALGLGMRPGKSELYRRVIMLLKNQPLEDRAPRFWTISATAAAVVLAALTAAISLAPRAVAEEKPVDNQAAKDSGAARTDAHGEVLTVTADAISTSPFGEPSADGDLVGYTVTPAYYQLLGADMLQYCHISGNQQKNLQSISDEYMSHVPELREALDRDLAKLPPQQRSAKRSEIVGKLEREVRAAYRKKVEEVLTKGQVATFKHYIMASSACFLWDPRLHDTWRLGISAQQGQLLEPLGDEIRRAYYRIHAQASQRVLAVLTPEQRHELVASVPHADVTGPFVTVPVRSPALRLGTGAGSPCSPLFQINDSGGASLTVCPTLTEDSIHQDLDLSRQQKDKLLAIAKQFKAATQQGFKIYPTTDEGLDKLSADEQKAKRAECERKLQQIGSDTIRKIEAALGPQQWTALKRNVQKQHEDDALERLMYADDATLRRFNITQQQRAKLNESAEVLSADNLTVNRETGEKVLAVLTDEQRKKLEERLDQQGW